MASLQAALPGSYYTDDTHWRREADHVLSREWFCAGRLSTWGLESSDTSRLAVVDIAGESILVTRTREGALKAFFNVCRHRGSQVVPLDPDRPPPDPCAAAALRCPYHSWTYDLAGRLMRAPHTEDVTDFRRRTSASARSMSTPGPASSSFACNRSHPGESGERLVTRTGGLDFFPPGAAIPADDCMRSMDTSGVPYDRLTDREVAARWPAITLPDGTFSIFQKDTSIVPAGRGTATMQALARRRGARLYDESPVTGIRGGTVTTPDRTISAGRVVITADAWTNDLLAHLGARLPLTVLREQVTYFAPERPAGFGPDRLPVWIWMDDPSFYGFPTYEGPLVKAAQDNAGPGLRHRRRAGPPGRVRRARRRPRLQVRAHLRPGAGRPRHDRRYDQRDRPVRHGSSGSRRPRLPADLVDLEPGLEPRRETGSVLRLRTRR